MAHPLVLLASAALPLLNPEAHGAEPMTFAAYILQSNVINILAVALGLGFILSKLNIPQKLDETTQKAIQPLQDAQAFRNKTESRLTNLTLKFQTLDQAKSEILTLADETADSIKVQFQEKSKHALHGLSLSYDSKKQREESLLQAAILNEVVSVLFNEVESTLPALEICHEKLVQLLVDELQETPTTAPIFSPREVTSV